LLANLLDLKFKIQVCLQNLVKWQKKKKGSRPGLSPASQNRFYFVVLLLNIGIWEMIQGFQDTNLKEQEKWKGTC
jgi:hypothetical protein